MFTHSALLGMLLAMAHLPVIAMETCSAGNPGLPGIPGMPGRDGRNGEKGEKGEPGMPLTPGQVAQKGQKGERGEKGPAGKIGPSGVKGTPGFPGKMGPPGDKGDATVYEKNLKSAFSVSRRTDVLPQKNRPVIFKHVITNINNHFNTETGKFVCHIPGTYYFVFHTSSKESLCVSLMKDGKGLASFCDHSHNLYQVSSGGLSVYLNVNEAVWLETSENQGMIGIRGKESIFSGFLVKPH